MRTMEELQVVQQELINKQVEADIERTKALTREIEASIEVKRFQVELMKLDLEHKSNK